ncbi:MAG: RNase adaptor protein RapZ [Deltaproteobacteria bacterium RBG_19FT_COMBO_46_12]|nr:MAG: RNase adaptor protein RapZ [Deltaproteobacteria bacterium RBG_19FT_COMBO_46_12]
MRVILISGLSGSGKTTAIKALEDIGFYCVDNLPILLLPKFIELFEQSGGKISKVAVVEDIRGEASYPSSREFVEAEGEKDFLKDSREIIQHLKREGFLIEILFLESSDPVLMRRFSETRRQHPLAVGGSIREGLRLEREQLQGIRDMANQVIDTSELNVHQLKEKIQQYAQEERSSSHMTVALLSFGYSFGIPFEADLLMDVRFLPNPYFVEELKRLKGDHPKIAEYVLQWEETKAFLQHLQEFIRFLLPLYERERRTHLTIAVGCTGGRHRSIVIVNRLAEVLRDELVKRGIFLSVKHRDAEKG